MTNRIFGIIATASILVAPFCPAAVDSANLRWSELPPLPDKLGVAGAFAGVSRGALLVAGGANFPDQPPWAGGKKVWHDTVYALPEPAGPWQVAGHLPKPLGYGVSITTRFGLMCIGGSDSERHYADVFLFSFARGKLRVRQQPGLPVPLANAAGALVGETAFVAGGSGQPGEQTVLNHLFALNLSAARAQWRELEPCPGEARLLPVAGAFNGAFYLMGGAALRRVDGRIKRVYLRDAWRYLPVGGWERLPDLPRACAAAATPTPVVDSTLLLIGGDDGSLTDFQPVAKHPGFPKGIQGYRPQRGEWQWFGETPAPRATLPVVKWQGQFVLPSGEARPGVRSPQVWTLHLAPDAKSPSRR